MKLNRQTNDLTLTGIELETIKIAISYLKVNRLVAEEELDIFIDGTILDDMEAAFYESPEPINI